MGMSRPRWSFVYAVNILSCCAVVLLHTTLPVFTPQPTALWVKMVALQSMGIFAVPVFFMISGMNLLGYRQRESTRQFIHKRLWKVGRALIGGSIICYLLFCLFPHSFYGADQYIGVGGVFDFLRRFLTNTINDTYWFLYFIIYLYVLTPVLSLIIFNKRCLQYMLVLCFGISIGLPLLAHIGVNPLYTSTVLNWPLFTSESLLYFLLGYYLHTYWQPIPRQTVLAAVVFVLAAIGMCISGLWLNGYWNPGGLSASYDSYAVGITSPLCVLQSCALFLLIRSGENWLRACGPRVDRILRTIAGASLGIYLFQILFIDWVGGSLPPQLSGVLGRHPVIYAATVYVCTLTVVLIGKTILAGCKKLIKCARLRMVPDVQ